MFPQSDVPHEVTIGDLLRLALPLDTRLIGGGRETRRNVHWVAILTDWEGLENQVLPNDLVIITPNLQQELQSTKLDERVGWLAGLPVAGLVLFTDQSDEFAQRIELLNVTVLVVPEDSTAREIHQSISQLLLDRQSATSERAIQLYRQLAAMSREGKGLQSMTDVMCKLTGNIVAVQDKRLEVKAISWPTNTAIDHAALVEALENRDDLPPVLRNRKAAARSRQSYWQQLLPLNDAEPALGRLLSPIVSGDRARGYLSIIGPAGELDLLDSLTVEHGAAACALEMAKAKAVSEAKKALRGDFLEGLLAGTMPKRESERLESRLDHDTKEPHAVLVVGWMGKPRPSLRRLETSIHWVLSNHLRPALVHIFGNQHVVIFQALKAAEDMESAQQLGSRVREQVQSEFPDDPIVGGIAGPAQTLGEWPEAYGHALQAMQLGERLRLANQFVEFESLGVLRLLYQLEDQPHVRAFVDEYMRPLVDYDAQNRGSLVKTIEAYFNHHGNISQTAESLFVHRNTLLYRLERVQELSGLQLDQPNMRLALHLSLKLWQIRPKS